MPTGGQPAPLVSNLSNPAHFAVDTLNVYWTIPSMGEVFSLPLTATGSPGVVASALDAPTFIAADDAIYVTTSGSILKIAK